MAIFIINNKSADTLEDAINICREEWTLAKADAVLEQKKIALSKPTSIDIERAALGVVANIDAAKLGAKGQ